MYLKSLYQFGFGISLGLLTISINTADIAQNENDTPPLLLQNPALQHHDQPNVVKGKHLINEIVAIVNDQPITLGQLNAEVLKVKAQLQAQPNANIPDTLTLQRQVLQSLINQTIALQMAKRQGISISDAEVNAAIDEITTQSGMTLNALKQQLTNSGISFSNYFDTIKRQLTINKLQQRAIAGQVYISPKDIDKYIQKNFSDKDTVYKVRNIVLPLPQNADQQQKEQKIKEANQLIEQINTQKISFAEAAKKYSQSTNASEGGDLGGWKTVNMLPDMYAQMVQQMQTGAISAPFIANNGIQIIQLEERKTPESAKHFITQYKVRQIAIDVTPIVNDEQAKAKLMRILSAIDNGSAFPQMAKSNSDNHDNADEGGDMGWITLNTVPPDLAKEIKTLKQNTISKPFKVGDQWQIIEVTDQREKDNTEAYQKDQALNALFQENARQAVKTWMLSLRDSAYVKILDPQFDIAQ